MSAIVSLNSTAAESALLSGGTGVNTNELAKKIRRHALEMTSRGGSAHIGAAFSCADLLAVLYGSVMKVDPMQPKAPWRDRFILSKGHAGCAVYAVLAELGFFPVERLLTHYQDGSTLCGHVSHKGIPGVEVSTGSLGHGLSIGAGMAYAAKLDARRHRVFVVLGDGECDEGSTWEAILFSAHHQLHNLIAVVDYNKIQSLGPVAETLGLEPFADKWRSFGWNVHEARGHDHDDLRRAFGQTSTSSKRPSVVIAHTVKGKGVSFMENSVLWHYRIARGAEYDAAVRELEEA
jgi:transketolase